MTRVEYSSKAEVSGLLDLTVDNCVTGGQVFKPSTAPILGVYLRSYCLASKPIAA